tara:strand:- start:31 stop:201 length:171 start_codon:yes stop_codon:yes gene_type:complete
MFGTNEPTKGLFESDEDFEERKAQHDRDNRTWLERKTCTHGNDKETCSKCNSSWLG